MGSLTSRGEVRLCTISSPKRNQRQHCHSRKKACILYAGFFNQFITYTRMYSADHHNIRERSTQPY